MSEEEQYQATQQLALAERGVVPKRLHRVTALLRHDVAEARRQKLPPAGRRGAWQFGEAPSQELGPDDVSSWHGVKVSARSHMRKTSQKPTRLAEPIL